MQWSLVKKSQNMLSKIKKKFKINKYSLIEIIFITASFLFSFWLMFSTFSYSNGSMQIAVKAWSDFASHIPLIRSFSFGSNFPPEYPLFPGEPIRYHFLFYALVGMLEKIGVRIDYALNIPSAIGFLTLLLIIYFFAKKLFKNTSVGIISVIFFLFNGSLSFIEFLKTHPLSTGILSEIISNKTFPSFGPYDGKIVSAFWNLNIYTNQRHFAFSLGLSLSLIYLFLRPLFNKQETNIRINIFLGICLGLFFYFHTAVFLMTVISLTLMGIYFRKSLLLSAVTIVGIGSLIALPQYQYLGSASSNFNTSIIPGYLTAQNLNFLNFASYWFNNLGLHALLIPFGFLWSTLKQKKIFLAFFSLFLVGNLFQFTPDMPTNHKFFNYFMLIGVMFSAFALVKLWKLNYLKPAVIILFFFMILSGIIDFFPIYNDSKITLADYTLNPDVKWIIKNTNPDSVFLNSQYLYTPESIAGRKILFGWPYFSWGAGYDSVTRYNMRKILLNPKSKEEFCSLTKKFNISFVDINNLDQNDPDLPINKDFFSSTLTKTYENQTSQNIIYNTKICF